VAERKRLKLNLTLHEETRQRLEDLARRHQTNLSTVVEQLVDEAWDTEDNYMLKQAAIQSFIGAALAIATANATLGPERTAAVRQQAGAVAVRLFGAPPTKRFALRDGVESDPRVEALFNAFEGD
jgi:hypothetical protein